MFSTFLHPFICCWHTGDNVRLSDVVKFPENGAEKRGCQKIGAPRCDPITRQYHTYRSIPLCCLSTHTIIAIHVHSKSNHCQLVAPEPLSTNTCSRWHQHQRFALIPTPRLSMHTLSLITSTWHQWRHRTRWQPWPGFCVHKAETNQMGKKPMTLKNSRKCG